MHGSDLSGERTFGVPGAEDSIAAGRMQASVLAAFAHAKDTAARGNESADSRLQGVHFARRFFPPRGNALARWRDGRR
jgi:hypothetical protein